MKKLGIVLLLMFLLAGCGTKPENVTSAIKINTICNPVNISYRFALDEPSRREAADPSVVWYKDRHYLFASKSGGYWHSNDLANWSFVETTQIPTEEYAPTAVVLDDTLYFLASSNELSTIYKSTDPLAGEWSVAVPKLEIPVWDPAFYLNEDDRLYLYWGCSDSLPIYGVEVDYKNGFSFIGEIKELIHANPTEHGWEVPGDYNTIINQSPWIEGAWMTKKNGKFYLQYSGPGTEFKSYSDGVYVSENPLGPFVLQKHNPFAYKPEGFAAGAGHGGLFTDQYGNAWQMGTITISQKHMFERRLGIYPAFYDEDGILYSITKYGDYPIIMPTKKANSFEDVFPGWMLLTYGKIVEVSSSIDTLPAQNMTDEDIRTYWAAQSGGDEAYATVDLGEIYDVYAIQINFAEHNTSIVGRQKNLFHRYTIEYSDNGSDWKLLVDQSNNDTDNTHDYIQLEDAVSCRYLKINNIKVPDGHFAISDFRAFGMGNGNKPGPINQLEVMRKDDKRKVEITWEKSQNATGYVISYGSDENKLYHNYMVYGDTTVTINTLNTNQDYYFTIEAFNENGITSYEDIVTTAIPTTE